jgi:hypothetical protein
MKIAIAAALSVACIAGSFSAPAQAQSALGGRYQVNGKNPNGTTYSGTAEIAVTSANTCRITWVTGGTTSVGICMRNKTVFSAAYRMGNLVGLVIYEIRPEGIIDGIWTVADQNGVGSEVLTPMR